MAVKRHLQQVFEQWGCPVSIRFDNGLPWGTASKVPSAFALWLVGLGIKPIFGRPRQSTDNAVVERSHGVLNGWVEPQDCATVLVLQECLTHFSSFQRETYPACQGQSRQQTYPGLLVNPRRYHGGDDARIWSEQAMFDYLATFRFHRKVEANGRITLLNREYYLGRAFQRRTLAVKMNAETRQWVLSDEYGEVLGCLAPKDLTYQTISTLTLAYRRRK